MTAKTIKSRLHKSLLPYLSGLIGLVIFILFPRGYHLGLAVIYLLANLFVYSRLKRVLAAGRLKHPAFPGLYLLLAGAYPLVELLAHASQAGLLKYLLLLGYYSLPFLLYLFLLLALGELGLLLIRRLKSRPPRILHTRGFAVAVLVMLLAGPLGIVILGGYHYENIKVNEYRVAISARSARMDHLRIALAADFHIGDVSEPRQIEKIIRAINSAKPDIILLAGDMMEGDRKDFALDRYASLFRRLRAKYGVYASLGNHDLHRQGDRAAFFDPAGIELLDDRWVVIDRSFCLAGRSDRPRGSKQSLERVLRDAPADLPVILMDHRPSAFAETLRQRVDIQLSGHSHHGQFFPVNWITDMKYDLSWGAKRIHDTHFFVTCGAQAWGPPARTIGDSEVMLIQVAFVHRRP